MRLIQIALPALLLTGAAGMLIAQAPSAPPGKADASLVTAGTYTLDPDHTLVEWTVDHLGFSPYFGLFGKITGTLELDPANPAAAKVDVTIPVSKVLTANPALTGHLLKPAAEGGKADFFGANPDDSHFVSTGVVANVETATITGNLTLNGVTKPVTLEATFYGAGAARNKENLGFTATGTIKRSEFGIGFGIPMVSDAVQLRIAAAFQK